MLVRPAFVEANVIANQLQLELVCAAMKAINALSRQELFDRTGIALSTICLIHCTVLPLAFAALQVWGISALPKSMDNEGFHLFLAFSLLGIGGIAFVSGYFRHRKILPLAGGFLGTLLLFLGATHPFSAWGELAAHALTILGTLILLGAHFKNRLGLKQLCPYTDDGCVDSHEDAEQIVQEVNAR